MPGLTTTIARRTRKSRIGRRIATSASSTACSAGPSPSKPEFAHAPSRSNCAETPSRYVVTAARQRIPPKAPSTPVSAVLSRVTSPASQADAPASALATPPTAPMIPGRMSSRSTSWARTRMSSLFQLFQSQVIFSQSGGMTSVRTTIGPSGERSTRIPPATISGVRIGSIVARKSVQAAEAFSASVVRTSAVLFQARPNVSISQSQALLATERSGALSSQISDTRAVNPSQTAPPTLSRNPSAGTASWSQNPENRSLTVVAAPWSVSITGRPHDSRPLTSGSSMAPSAAERPPCRRRLECSGCPLSAPSKVDSIVDMRSSSPRAAK